MAQIKSLNCPNCGGSIPDTSKACSFCGSRVVLSDDRQKFVLAGTICPKCGLDNKDQHRFCSKCGEKLFKKCLNCHKEIGLDSIHCPFCGDNIEEFEKKRQFYIESIKGVQSEENGLLSEFRVLSSELDRLDQEKGVRPDTDPVLLCTGVTLILSLLLGLFFGFLTGVWNGIAWAIITIFPGTIIIYLICLLYVHLKNVAYVENVTRIDNEMKIISEKSNKVYNRYDDVSRARRGIEHAYKISSEDLGS